MSDVLVMIQILNHAIKARKVMDNGIALPPRE